jgi:hypothetical protein
MINALCSIIALLLNIQVYRTLALASGFAALAVYMQLYTGTFVKKFIFGPAVHIS